MFHNVRPFKRRFGFALFVSILCTSSLLSMLVVPVIDTKYSKRTRLARELGVTQPLLEESISTSILCEDTMLRL